MIGILFWCINNLWLTIYPANKSIKITLTISQGINEEAQQRQLVGDRLKIHLIWLIARLCELFNAITTFLNGCHRREMSEHRQCTTNLLEWPIQLGQILHARRFTEEGIKRLLNLCQIALYFLTNLPDQQALLRPTSHFIEQRDVIITQHLARYLGMQTGNHKINLLSKISTKTFEIFLGILKQQDCCCDFHRDAVIKAFGIFSQPVSNRDKALPQTLEISMWNLGNQLTALAPTVHKCSQR